ncbi:hypothetical protein FNYG_15084 [Fusarium nygamai]|uniref:Uncharacterized protein n=1 Tax=Gibberella nygamai TaxID=42673 RepID=A0A2K0UKV9_GIBNY|nr:hypothetical protein FNYG_15084 [Fusarium nygamai]
MIQYSRVDGHDFARISIRGKGEDWDAPVNPTHDIFCIRSKAWNTHDNHAEGWQIQLPDLSPNGSQSMNIQNIALEFNESWNKDLPKSYYELMSETSARGFLARLLYNRYLNDSITPQIWIIVKNGQWTIDPERQGTAEPWYDYDTDYVHVSPYFSCPHRLRKHDFDGVFRNVIKFEYSLDVLGAACERDHLDYMPRDYDGDWGFYESFDISYDVKFLAQRDMQIGTCTGRGPDEDEEEEEEEEDVDMGF